MLCFVCLFTKCRDIRISDNEFFHTIYDLGNGKNICLFITFFHLQGENSYPITFSRFNIAL